MNSCLLTLFILVGVSSAFTWFGPKTIVKGDGTIYCDVPAQWWCFQVSLYETDYPFGSDRVDSFGIRCSRSKSHDYTLSGFQLGDGPWNREYEFQLYIIHNCTSKGSRLRQIERNIQYADTSAEFVRIKPWMSSILNLGERISEYD